jgi:hypothetical protein
VVPVLSIAPDAKFKGLKKIVLATDYEELKNRETLDTLKSLAGLFHSHIDVLNVTNNKEAEIPSLKRAIGGITLEHMLEGYRHSFHTSSNKNTVDGINKFVESHNADLVVMVPRSRSFIRSIFPARKSKQMLFHTNTPLLTIHE